MEYIEIRFNMFRTMGTFQFAETVFKLVSKCNRMTSVFITPILLNKAFVNISIQNNGIK